MISGMGAVVLDTAIKVGAPLVKSILQKSLGGSTGGILADVILDKVSDKVGVPVEKLDTVNPGRLELAVREVERETPEIINAYLETQREMNRMQIAELDKSESTWTWAWRPAWMWLLGFLWVYAFVLQPLIKAALITSLMLIDVSVLMTVTGIFVTFYMGGHTAKSVVETWKDGKNGSG